MLTYVNLVINILIHVWLNELGFSPFIISPFIFYLERDKHGLEWRRGRRKTMATGFGFVFLLKLLLGLNFSHQIFFLHMAPIYVINGLNGDILKWRIAELRQPYETYMLTCCLAYNNSHIRATQVITALFYCIWNQFTHKI
jgi:hypothetical protein